MARLPKPGGDSGNWGDILNEYLSQSHTSDGSIKFGAVTKSHVGLGSVDNTSDINKPVSAAQQVALDTKLTSTALDGQTAAQITDTTSATATAISNAVAAQVKSTTALASWFKKLTKDPADAKIALIGDSTRDVNAAGVNRHNALKRHITQGGALEGMNPANLLNFGYNGQTVEGITTDANMAALAAASPDLIDCSMGINNIKGTDLTVDQMASIIKTGIEKIRTAIPGVPIVASIPNSFKTTADASNYITPNDQAAAKSVTLRAAWLSLVDRWIDVIVLDTFDTYGPSKATSPFLSDQIHPNTTGAYAAAISFVGLIGRIIPIDASGQALALASNPYDSWSAYGRSVEDTTRFTLVASGTYGGSVTGSYINLNYPYNQRGNLRLHDLIELPDGQVFRLNTLSFGTPGNNILRILGNNIPSFTLTATGTTSTVALVRVWRRTAAADLDVNGVLKDGSWRYKRYGTISTAPNGTTLTITATSVTASPPSETAAQWAEVLAAGDKVYIDGLGASNFTLGTNATATASGSNILLSGLTSADRTALLGRMVVIVGTHADSLTGTGVVGPAGKPGSVVVSGRFAYQSVYGSTSANAGTLGTEYAVPLVLLADTTITSLGIDVSTAVAGSSVRLGIRSDNAGLPGTVLVDGGVALDTSTATFKSTTISQAVTAGTLYWLVAQFSGSAAANLKVISGTSPYILHRGVHNELGLSSYALSGRLSSPFTDTALVSSGVGLSVPSNYGPLILAGIA